MDQSKLKIVYCITKRENKSYWNRVGVAFVNNDGSINVKLDAVPLTGTLQVRDYSPRDDFAGPALREGNGAGEMPAEFS